MMPAALAVMWLECLYLSRLWRPVEVKAPVPVPAVVAPASPPHWAARRIPLKAPRPDATPEQPLLEIRDAAP